MAVLQPGAGLHAVGEACGPASRQGVSLCAMATLRKDLDEPG
jgi:hypothetical protein